MPTNALGPMSVLPQLADALPPGARVAVISSRMGSIGLRASANGSLCRASKAALNSVLKNASLARLQSTDNGRFFNHDGAELAW
jgi:hypothetical protein